MKSKSIASAVEPSVSTLGSKPVTETAPEVWQRYRKRLLQLRAKVVDDANELAIESVEAAMSFSMHLADAASDSFHLWRRLKQNNAPDGRPDIRELSFAVCRSGWRCWSQNRPR